MQTSNYTISFATLLDLPDIRRLWHAMMQEINPPYPTDMAAPATVDEFTRQAAHVLADPNPATFCLVARTPDGEAIGFHCFGYQGRDLGLPRVVAFTYWIYVTPAHRSAVLAEDLARLACEHALANGIVDAEMTRLPGETYRKGLGYEPFEVRAHAPVTLILTRIEERRRRREERAARQNGHDMQLPLLADAPEEEETLP